MASDGVEHKERPLFVFPKGFLDAATQSSLYNLDLLHILIYLDFEHLYHLGLYTCLQYPSIT
jgi:hypothetical protein